MRRIISTAWIILTIGCHNSANPGERTAKTRADSLMDEVIKGHNMGMGKISRIHETQKKVQHAIDSISKLPAAVQKKSMDYKMQLNAALEKLNFADYAMERWMNEFNMDSSSDNEEKRMEYLRSEKTKVTKVTDSILKSLQGADSLLKR